jgi:hypothetical protein
MKKAKHSEEKIIGAVKQMEAGRSVKELARELGVTDQTGLLNQRLLLWRVQGSVRWRAQYGQLAVTRRLAHSASFHPPGDGPDNSRADYTGQLTCYRHRRVPQLDSDAEV